jgi:hypothetical protein
MLSNLPIPACMENCPMENMHTFKETLEKLKTDANDRQVAAKTCYDRIKFLVDSTENNTKMFADLRKGEVKNFQKAKDTFTSRIKKFYDTRHKIETMEVQIADLQGDVALGKLREKELQAAKNKLRNLHSSLLKTKVEYTQMKVDAKEISKEFNMTKHKFARVFNAYAENVEIRVRDNLAFFVQKIGEFLASMKMNGSQAISASQSMRAIDEDLTRSLSASVIMDLSISQLSTQLAENRLVIEEIKFEEEKISDPDLYLKFMNFVEGEPKHILGEIDVHARKVDPKVIDAVYKSASNVILGRCSLADIVLATKRGVHERSFGNRVAAFLITMDPKFGRLSSKAIAETTAEELLRSLLRTLLFTSVSRVGKRKNRGQAVRFLHFKAADDAFFQGRHAKTLFEWPAHVQGFLDRDGPRVSAVR